MRALHRVLGGLAATLALSVPATAQISAPSFRTANGVNDGQGVIAIGGSSITTGQVSVGTTATLVAAASARQSIDVTVDGAVKCYLGPAGVTTATGFPLQAVAGASKTIPSSAAIYAVCASTVTLGWMQHQ
jgi:hypothetical protein